MKRCSISCAVLLLVVSCTGMAGSISGVDIHDIQGDSHSSPLDGKRVSGVEGVVTMTMTDRNYSRFWIQSLSPDSDPSTSEGLRIFIEGSDVALPDRGSIVEVNGVVEEYAREGDLPATSLVDATWTVTGRAELPEPVDLSTAVIPGQISRDELSSSLRTHADLLDFWESLEGMLVEIDSPIVSGPTSRFDDFVVIPAGDSSEPRTWRGGARLTADDENLEKIIIDTRGPAAIEPLETGDRIHGRVRGVAEYGFGRYRVIVSELPQRVEPARTTVFRDRSPFLPREETLEVASYNVLNLSVAGPEERIEALARSIVIDLQSPDVIALQEIQDDSGQKDDGVVTARGTLEALVEAIEAAGGPAYDYRQIDPIDNADGGAPGGNIRNAFLFRTDQVRFVDRGIPSSDHDTSISGGGNPVLTRSPGRIGTASPCFVRGEVEGFEGTRKPLVGEIIFRGERYFFINTHLKSKGGDDSLFGSTRPPRRRTERQRICQAELVADFVTRIFQADPGAKIVALGDFNEHEFREPMRILTEAGLINLIERIEPERRYTYNYLGNSQVLDHILVSGTLDESRAAVVHVNADFPDDDRVSDHDPVVASLMTREE